LGWASKETSYSLRAVPMGGFCRMLGEDPEESEMPDNFTKKPLLNRIIVVAAGSLMNFVLAILIFFSVFYLISGIPEQESTRIGSIESGMPAEEAGLEAGDKVLYINDAPVDNWNELVEQIEERPGEKLDILYERDGQQYETIVVPVEDEVQQRARIGIAVMQDRFNLVESAKLSYQNFASVFIVLYQYVTDQLPEEVEEENGGITGPVGIVFLIRDFAAVGIESLMLLTALLSINLGIVNLLPIPALDGGRLLFLFVEGIRGRPVDPEKEGLIHFIGFALLITFILVITYRDLFQWGILE